MIPLSGESSLSSSLPGDSKIGGCRAAVERCGVLHGEKGASLPAARSVGSPRSLLES
jgi:hypothetical protein